MTGFSQGRFTGGVASVRPGAVEGTYAVRHADASILRETDAFVGVTLNLSAGHRVRYRAGRLSDDRHPAVGTATVCAPGERARAEVFGAVRVLRAELRVRTLAAHIAEEREVDPAGIEFRGLLHVDDPILSRLLFDAFRGARGASGARGSHGPHCGEALERALALHLHAVCAGGKPLPRLGGIAPHRLRRLLDFVEAAPPATIDLRRMSALVGMSPFHFAREFKGTVGETPMRFVARRLALRGLASLSAPDVSIGDAARRSGFAHASHLARHARRLTGVTPSRFRSDLLA